MVKEPVITLSMINEYLLDDSDFHYASFGPGVSGGPIKITNPKTLEGFAKWLKSRH